MAITVNKTSRAELDIADATHYLLERKPRAAERFLLDLRKLARTLSRFPELFPVQRRSIRPEWQNVRIAVLRRFR